MVDLFEPYCENYDLTIFFKRVSFPMGYEKSPGFPRGFAYEIRRGLGGLGIKLSVSK